MDIIFYAFLLLLVIFSYYFYTLQFSFRKLPPGPLTFPFGLGVIPSSLFQYPELLTKQRPWEFMDYLSKHYGDLFSLDVGPFYAIVISSYELLQEVANMDEYSNKFSHENFTYFRTFNKELGILFQGKPPVWTEMRKFTQRTLRNFGLGKRNTMQSAIEAETSIIVQQFKEAVAKNDGIISIRTTFALPLLNVLWCMVAGQRYDHNDPNLLQLMEQNFLLLKSIKFGDPMELTFKWLKRVFPSLFSDDLRHKVCKEAYKFMQTLVDEKKMEGNYKHGAQNYIDEFLKEIERNQTNPKSLIYTDEQLLVMLSDLLIVSTSTSNGSLNYGLLYLLLNSDVQLKCQQEIDALVPKHLTPTLDDIEKMTYFQAVILETHRLANVVPIPIPRTTPKDFNIRGYRIPKGTMIISNHYSVHMSEENWKDPDVFRPERFLDENGNFFLDKRVIHFGLGKRICLGKILVDSTVPIFLATLLQQFNFSIVPGTLPPTTEPEPGASLCPMEFQVKVSIRE